MPLYSYFNIARVDVVLEAWKFMWKLVSVGVAVVSSTIVHVSIIGDDATGDGSVQRPFGTVGVALEAGRSEIAFGPGLHMLPPGGLKFGPADANVQLSGAGMDITQLSGATKLANWTASNGLWKCALKRNGSELLMQMFVPQGGGNFSRRLTGRSATMQYEKTSKADPMHAIVYRAGQVAPSYTHQNDLLVTVYHCWTATTHRVRSISARNRTLTLYNSPHVDIARCDHASGKRFYLENAPELLTTPGQFYFDRSAGVVLYMPLPEEGETGPAAFVAYAPSAVTLMDVQGEASKPVVGLAVRNLSFVHAAADMAGFFEGDCDGQAATNLKSAAVQFGNARGIVLSDVGVAHTGGFGVHVGENCSDVEFSHGRVSDTGAGGFRIGGDSAATAPTGVVLQDSELSDGGHIYRMGRHVADVSVFCHR